MISRESLKKKVTPRNLEGHIQCGCSSSDRARLKEFIVRSNNEFEPPLSERLDLELWISDSLKNAIVNFYEADGCVIGLLIYYCTPRLFDYAFITYICVDRKAVGRGIGHRLIDNAINYCRGKKMRGIESKTWSGNKASRALFKKNGFKELGQNFDRSSDNATVLLRLDFEE